MQKLQCLAVARATLQGTLKNAVEHIKDNHAFRNRFEDQLQVNYREWLFKKVDEEFIKKAKSSAFQTAIVSQELD